MLPDRWQKAAVCGIVKSYRDTLVSALVYSGWARIVKSLGVDAGREAVAVAARCEHLLPQIRAGMTGRTRHVGPELQLERHVGVHYVVEPRAPDADLGDGPTGRAQEIVSDQLRAAASSGQHVHAIRRHVRVLDHFGLVGLQIVRHDGELADHPETGVGEDVAVK